MIPHFRGVTSYNMKQESLPYVYSRMQFWYYEMHGWHSSHANCLLLEGAEFDSQCGPIYLPYACLRYLAVTAVQPSVQACNMCNVTAPTVDILCCTLSSFCNILSNSITYQDNKNRNNSYSLRKFVISNVSVNILGFDIHFNRPFKIPPNKEYFRVLEEVSR